MFASIYLATDILNDIYGRKQARKAVWLGFSSVIVMVILLQCSLAFIPAQEDISQEALETIFNIVPRIALGSIIAYIIGQHLDVLLFTLIKKKFSSDRTFYIRAYGSTVVSSIVDTAIFVLIAFYGNLPNNVVFEIFFTTYFLNSSQHYLTYHLVTLLNQCTEMVRLANNFILFNKNPTYPFQWKR